MSTGNHSKPRVFGRAGKRADAPPVEPTNAATTEGTIVARSQASVARQVDAYRKACASAAELNQAIAAYRNDVQSDANAIQQLAQEEQDASRQLSSVRDQLTAREQHRVGLVRKLEELGNQVAELQNQAEDAAEVLAHWGTDVAALDPIGPPPAGYAPAGAPLPMDAGAGGAV